LGFRTGVALSVYDFLRLVKMDAGLEVGEGRSEGSCIMMHSAPLAPLDHKRQWGEKVLVSIFTGRVVN